jgi:5'-3' exonuclease
VKSEQDRVQPSNFQRELDIVEARMQEEEDDYYGEEIKERNQNRHEEEEDEEGEEYDKQERMRELMADYKKALGSKGGSTSDMLMQMMNMGGADGPSKKGGSNRKTE